MKFENALKLKAFVGEEHGGDGYIEMEYNSLDNAVIIRDSKDVEIWLEVESMDRMVKELKNFIKTMNAIEVKTK